MEPNGKIYSAPRLAAGLTQERASELIGVSTRSLQAYEQGERIPADDVVVRMVEIYNTQYLAYQHLRSNMELARSILPEVSVTTLPIAMLRLQKEVNDVLRVRDEMLDITCDGVIDEDEQPRWVSIIKELDDLCNAIISVKMVVPEVKK